MYLETIVALSLVFSYIAASRQVNLTIQVRGLRQHKGETHSKHERKLKELFNINMLL